MIKNFTVGFQLKRNKKRRDGKAPIYLRVTVNGKRIEVATRRAVNVDNWDNSQQRIRGRSENARVLNSYLSGLETDVLRYYNKLLEKDDQVTVGDFKHKFLGDDIDEKLLLQVFKENTQLVKLEQGSRYAKSTVMQYETTFERLKKFVLSEYGISDIELSKLDVNFIRRFDIFLRAEFKIGHNTTMKYLKQLKKVIHFAMELGYIHKDPFASYKTNYTEVNRGFLTAEELKCIKEKRFRIRRLDLVRDIFVFVCYTGLSYSDLKQLKPKDISKGIDGKNWIIYEREKTGVRASIPILPPAQAVIDKYKNDTECIALNMLLPVKSNQKLNTYLEEIAELCEIDKHITMHLGRHTFATTVTLTNGVPIETVQKMLGHKNLSTTQIYSKVVDIKISEDMKLVEQKIS
ncbi:site-specific integrase [Draconibacterium sp. IB214405]|uniref:site-specific integrase n=1 Tax=Draconibacterium sp. IB214405 TaxID=3097352 RepID=UPI002A0B93D6|nr:site-specific integrase [Draconibacterium sp. IB214405]MDX8338763.1 site-specific integrase [Draconibacterium sp. IB214405]